MAEYKDVVWGTPPDEGYIKNDLKTSLGGDLTVLKVEHIKSGFTDNVFLVEVVTEGKMTSLILKQFIEDWHLKEIEVYEQILMKDRKIKAPDLIAFKDNRMYLQYFSPSQYEIFEKSKMEDLYQWIVYKHWKYKGQSDKHVEFIEKDEIRKHYLLNKPLKKINEILGDGSVLQRMNTSDLQSILSADKRISELFGFRSGIELTLEHGDLEPQNLFYCVENRELGVIDWTNAKFSEGFTDLNQFLENCTQYKIHKIEYLERFKADLNVENFEFLLNRNRVFMILNKLHYYLGKYQEGILVSGSNGRDIVEIINELAQEEVALIKDL